MASGMTVQERIEDIVKRSGLSEPIVRRVMQAETESCIESLKRGERTTLIGRCTLRPELRTKLAVGGTMSKVVKITAAPSKSLEDELQGLTDWVVPQEEDNSLPPGIRIMQIPGLL